MFFEMEGGTTISQSFEVIEWNIENFSFWHNEVHDRMIKSPILDFTLLYCHLELYPRDLSGVGERLVVRICDISDSCDGDLSFYAPDGSVISTLDIKSKKGESVLQLPPGPRFKDVIQTRKDEKAQKDVLILRCRLTSVGDRIYHVRTILDVFDTSLKISSKMFKNIPFHKKEHILTIQYPFDGREGKINFFASSNLAYTKVKLILEPYSNTRNILVLTSISVLNCNNALTISEENSYIFHGDQPWIFSDSLLMKMLLSEEFTLLVQIKVVSKNKPNNIIHYLIQPREISVMKANEGFVNCLKSSDKIEQNQSDNSIRILSDELMSLYQDQDFSDFQLCCGDTSFAAHKGILSARSPVFKLMLSSDMSEAETGSMNVSDMDVHTLGRFLSFLYSGTVDDLQWEAALKLYYAADKYQVSSLKEKCSLVLCSDISFSNVCDILSLADKHVDDDLASAAHDFMVENFNEVLKSEEWEIFMNREPLLASKTITHFARKNYVTKNEAP